jgi:SAM-dependent methyltransferase
MPGQPPAICDYEGSSYRTDFWEGKGREYEDAVERIALRALLPPAGQRYVEFGAGFGRLINEAGRYDQVVLVDYSRTLLAEAQARLGRSERYLYVAADVYNLPFVTNAFDVAIMCRVIHHLADVPAALRQIRASLTPGATFVLEFANKRNLKAIARYLLGRQDWNPFAPEPVEFVKLNFDFHPAYIQQALQEAGFVPGPRRNVSMLRLGLFKTVLPLGAMLALERLIQPTGSLLPISPSIFVRNGVSGSRGQVVARESLFKCPACGSADLEQDGDVLVCRTNAERWAIRDGIYDFKEPLSA